MPPPYPRALRSLARIALRQTTTTLSTTHSIPPTRSISITSTAAAAAARGATRPSPRRRRQQLANGSLGQNVELPRDMSVDEVLPPVAYLKSAQKAGALDMVPERARSVVALYFKASRELKTGDWERDFLAESNATPASLTMLANILIRCTGLAQKKLGRNLILTASNLGDPFAIISLARVALTSADFSLPHHAASVAKLRDLVERDKNLEAMVLLGKVHEAQGDEDGALSLFTRAAATTPLADAESSASPTAFAAQDSYYVGEGLLFRGELYARRGNTALAINDFRRAALELDHPAAYYQLARSQHDNDEAAMAAKEVYLLKAAIAGFTVAYHDLGILLKDRARTSDSKSSRAAADMAMAKEWLYLAASTNFVPSMIILAELLATEGNFDQARTWLANIEASAEASETARQEARTLREKWQV